MTKLSSSEETGLSLYTEKDLARARSRGKMVGWVQGGVATLVGGMVLQFIGWIPAVMVLGAVAYVLYRFMAGGKSKDEPAV